MASPVESNRSHRADTRGLCWKEIDIPSFGVHLVFGALLPAVMLTNLSKFNVPGQVPFTALLSFHSAKPTEFRCARKEGEEPILIV